MFVLHLIPVGDQNVFLHPVLLLSLNKFVQVKDLVQIQRPLKSGVLGVSVTGGNIALRAGKQPIKNVIARHCELTRFDYWYCFFISAVK